MAGYDDSKLQCTADLIDVCIILEIENPNLSKTEAMNAAMEILETKGYCGRKYPGEFFRVAYRA